MTSEIRFLWIEQFHKLLSTMYVRSHEKAEASCYMRFEMRNSGHDKSTSSTRFIQFSFEKNAFQLDLPPETLRRSEAEKLRESRTRFFYLSERPAFRLNSEESDRRDPFRAAYPYGEERAAAEDTAFIFFELWGLAGCATVSVHAASFNGKFSWEDGFEIWGGHPVVSLDLADAPGPGQFRLQ